MQVDGETEHIFMGGIEEVVQVLGRPSEACTRLPLAGRWPGGRVHRYRLGWLPTNAQKHQWRVHNAGEAHDQDVVLYAVQHFVVLR